MILYFVRHGEAGAQLDGPEDDARPLTPSGAAALEGAAPLWRSLNLRPEVVVSSPLARAHRTAELLVAGLGLPDPPLVDDRLRPGARWPDLARAMAAHPAARRVAFVGHQPDLSEAIRVLTGGVAIRLRPGGLACVEFPGVPEPGAGELAWLIDPDLYVGLPAGGTQVTRIAAYALCLDEARRILLARLSPSEIKPGWWTLPGGGIEFGESPAEAVLRELAEETGLSGEIVSLAEVASWVRRGPVAPFAGEDFQAIQVIYRVRVTGGSLRDEPDGSTDAADWFTRAQAEELPLVDLARIGLRLAFGERG